MKKKLIATTAALTLLLCMVLTSCTGSQTKAERAGWKLAVQSYTFHKFTLLEALDKTQQLGVKYIEVYPGHKLGGRWGDQPFDFNLDEQSQQELRDIARQKGITIVGSGVFTSDNPDDWDKMFRFASSMHMDLITCEPPLALWDHIEALADKYQIQVAVHNHPQPSEYWHPQRLLDAIATRSPRIGSCADVGHWKREGLDHIDCLRRLQGRIATLHFKDIRPKQDSVEWQGDTIWGQGCLDVKAMLETLKQLHFKGYISIEYEYNWDNSVPDIQQCIQEFNRITDEIL